MNQRFSYPRRMSAAVLAGASLMLAACSSGELVPLATEPDDKNATCIDSVSAHFEVVEGEPKLTKLKDSRDGEGILLLIAPNGPKKLCGESDEDGTTTVNFVVSPEAATEMLTDVRELQMTENECTFLRGSTVEQEPCLYELPTDEEREALEEAFATELKGFQKDLPLDVETGLWSTDRSQFKLIRFNE